MDDATLTFQLKPVSNIEDLAMAWVDLEAQSDNEFFLSWKWISAWLTVIKRTPLLLSAKCGRRVVLLALLVFTRRRELGLFRIPGVRLHETGDPNEDAITIEYNGFLVTRQWRGYAEPAAIRFLLAGHHGVRVHELHIRGAPGSLEPHIFRRGFLSIPAWSHSWRVDLHAIRESRKCYLDQLSANTRQQIRRSMRLYEKRGKISFDRARDLDEALQYFAALKELHQRYWHSRGEPGAFAHPFFESFHRHLITSSFGAGHIEVARVSAGSTVVGYLYNFLYRGTVLSYQSGFAYDEDPKLKPGLVSHCLCIETHAAAGRATYDFMAGHAQHKASLGRRGPDMVYFLLQKPTALIRIVHILSRLRRWPLRKS